MFPIVNLRKPGARLAAAFAGIALTAGCGGPGDVEDGAPLVVLTRNAPTTWYQGRNGPEGLEYDLVTLFAEHLGVEAEFRLLDTVAEILAAIENGEAHLAAASLTQTHARVERGLKFGPAYEEIVQQVVCRRDADLPSGAAELAAMEVEVIAASSYVERLEELRRDHPELTWQEVDDENTETLLERVYERETDCTVADSNIVDVNRRFYPELEVAFELTEPQPLAWVFADDHAALAEHAREWLQDLRDSGTLAAIREKYYGHVGDFDYVDIAVFQRRIRERLPRYRKLFEAAAKKYDLPWTLLAAKAYQESHWDPEATSPTGVRGMMMLSETTAKAMGVTDRLDPRQSIDGGARYLRRMIDRIPDDVHGENRRWFALAAYNIGYGHLADARVLAERLGHDPDAWVGVKEVLPLLRRKKYYQTLDYGYARGDEAVRHVDGIRDFRQIIEEQH